jgi:BAI1-associated protein 3
LNSRWLRRPNAETGWDLRETLNDAVHSGAKSWFNKVNMESQDPDESDEEKLQYLVRIIQLVRSDLQKAIEFYDKAFQT